MTKKEIRIKIYKILEEKYGIMPSTLKELGIRKMMKQLSQQDIDDLQEKPEPKRFSSQPEIRTWREGEK